MPVSRQEMSWHPPSCRAPPAASPSSASCQFSALRQLPDQQSHYHLPNLWQALIQQPPVPQQNQQAHRTEHKAHHVPQQAHPQLIIGQNRNFISKPILILKQNAKLQTAALWKASNLNLEARNSAFKMVFRAGRGSVGERRIGSQLRKDILMMLQKLNISLRFTSRLEREGFRECTSGLRQSRKNT